MVEILYCKKCGEWYTEDQIESVCESLATKTDPAYYEDYAPCGHLYEDAEEVDGELLTELLNQNKLKY